MRVLSMVCVMLALAAVAVSAVDLSAVSTKKMAKSRRMQLQHRLDALKALDFPRFQTAEQLGWWDDNKCKFCKDTVGRLSASVVDAIISAPADASANSICLPIDGVFLPLCVAAVPGGSVACPPIVVYVHSKCTDAVTEVFNEIAKDVGKQARRLAKKLVPADLAQFDAAHFCGKFGLCP